MSQMSAVEEAIAAAKQQAAATPASSNAVAVAAPAAGGAVTTPATGMAMSMETLMMGGMSVEVWLKPNEYGVQVGTQPGFASEIRVAMEMVEGMGFIPKMAIKGGNPAQYRYTTDGVSCATGGSWADAQAQIRALDPKAAPYRCVDLPFTLLEDVKVIPPGQKTDVEVAKQGQRAGYTTSTTNWANWEQFYRECASKGLIGKDENGQPKRVEVLLGSQRRTNSKNNVWAVMTFKLVGELVAEEAE